MIIHISIIILSILGYDLQLLSLHSVYSVQYDIIEASEMVSGAPWGKLYKAHLWETVRFLEGYAFEDTIIFLNIYPQCKIFYNIQDPVYCFRSSSTSLFKQQTVLHGIDSLWVVINCVELAKENGINILDDGYYQLVMWHLSAIMR